MRILHTINSLRHGGAEHQLCRLVETLPQDQHTIAHLWGPSPLAERARAAGATVVDLGLERAEKRRGAPAVLAKLTRLIREVRPDVLHSSLFEANLITAAAARLTRTPAVSTLCNVGPAAPERLADNARHTSSKQKLATSVWGLSQRVGFRRFIAISEVVRSSMIRDLRLPAERVQVIPRGLPPGAERQTAPENQLRSAPTLISVGRLAPQKGHRDLLGALRIVNRTRPDVRLSIVGSGWLQAELEALSGSLGLEAHVSWLGHRGDVPELLRATPIFVFPSLFEGLGVAALEAAAAGCICVFSDIPALRELMPEEGAYWAPPRDEAALASAILAALSDPLESGRRARLAQEHVQRNFSIKSMATRTRAVYDACL